MPNTELLTSSHKACLHTDIPDLRDDSPIFRLLWKHQWLSLLLPGLLSYPIGSLSENPVNFIFKIHSNKFLPSLPVLCHPDLGYHLSPLDSYSCHLSNPWVLTSASSVHLAQKLEWSFTSSVVLCSLCPEPAMAPIFLSENVQTFTRA